MPRFSDFKGRGRGRDSRGGDRRGGDRFDRDDRRGGDRRDRNEETVVTCDGCGDKCKVPFKPRSNKPVYCDRCFKKEGPSKSVGVDLTEINEKLDTILAMLGK